MGKIITLTRGESVLLLNPLLSEIKFYRSLVSDIEASDIAVYYPDCTIEEANKIVASHRDTLHNL